MIAAARSCGADAVRIAPADPQAWTHERLAASFERGDLRTWPYDERYAARAADPRTLLADARSVVCIAVAYATPAEPPRPGRGRVSNYAWSDDYHRRMRALLTALAGELQTLGAATAIACDTAPVAERAFAERAGLGWIGKHTNLIAPGLGSFVFLGEVVTSLALEPDAPLKKTCGACTRCVTACPTGALRGDYTIDATRCISDLTQRTDPIPRELRPLIGTWVWGCDLCQDVCPPTRRAPRTAEAFAPLDAQTRSPDLTALLRLRSGEFKRRYARTALGWRGAALLRRNAAVALGNRLDRADVPALAAATAGDPHPQVRGHAAWALGRIGSPQALAALQARARVEPDALVSDEIRAAVLSISKTPRVR
ncbi:MAG: tRNA epoxyqueuosine(34) reductase QueG [Candidatus Lustribacter sp.]